VGTAQGSDGAALRALVAAPLPNLMAIRLTEASVSGADVSGVLSRAPWLATLTSLVLAQNQLDAPGHRALSLLHLPRLQHLYLDGNGLDRAGLAALTSAPWLTQLTKLALVERDCAPALWAQMPAIEETCDRVFDRLRRLGCDVHTRFSIVYRHEPGH
jgi:hypothetical protein